MDLVTFYGRLYGKINSKLYVFEPTWDSFRPIHGVGWNGKKFEIIEPYKQNLFDECYGYSSKEERTECRKLAEITELEGRVITDFWTWSKQKTVWWIDRPIVFLNECVSKDNLSWKYYIKYITSNPKTLRNIRGKLTRRNLRK